MSQLHNSIKNWIINETDGLVDGRLKYLPEASAISKLTEGKNKKIWKFVVKHVRSKQSVMHTKKFLHLRRVEKKHENYPGMDKENYLLQNKVDTAEDKMRFIERTTKFIANHISSIHTLVKNKKEENCILNQKCAIFELATLNLKEKNESLIDIYYQLFNFISKSFANDKTKCFAYPTVLSSSKNAKKKMMTNFNFDEDFIKSIIYEIMLVVKKELLCEDTNMSVTNVVLPLTRVMNHTLTADIVTELALISQKDLNFLKSNIEKPMVEKIERMSEIYLQSIKQGLVKSCFRRKKLGCKKISLEASKIQFIKDFSKLQQNYLSLQAQNECLADSIQYLKEQLGNELQKTENLTETNAKLKSQCQDIKKVIGDFHKNLRAMHELFNLLPQTFKSIRLSLGLSQTFIETQIVSTIQNNKDASFSYLVTNINCDLELSSELLESKEFLQDISKDFTFTKLNFPAKVWEFLSLEPFHNRHLLIERLAHIKRKLSVDPKQLCYISDDVLTQIGKKMISSVTNNKDNMEVVMRNLFDVEKSSKKLGIVLKDWWYQSAQFIPQFVYHGKTIKMWLAILNVLD